MAYAVRFRPSVHKDLKKLPDATVVRIRRAINALAENPRAHGVSKLAGFENRYRVRVGDYRVVYLIDDSAKLVRVLGVAHRGDAYN